MRVREAIADPAVVLALAEQVCPSLNGAASFSLAAALEDARVDSLGPEGPHSPDRERLFEALEKLDPERVDHWSAQLHRTDARVVTVLDDEYPVNLRMVHNRPPFLFVRGTLRPSDERAVAVVGTRKPSPDGARAAREIAAALADRGITVVSGLALGVDAIAHTAALERGGRTLAVLGSGIDQVHPRSNAHLAQQIQASGATVSQFWPDMRPTRWSFPVRNIVTSGLAVGSVVVEASAKSGARQQAEQALRHGKWLLLPRALVDAQPWAAELVDAAGVRVVDAVDDIVDLVETELDAGAHVSV